MKRIEIKSSNINSIGFDQAEEILEVEFKGGKIFQYVGVGIGRYNEMMRSKSIGSFLNGVIKKHYKCIPVEKTQVEVLIDTILEVREEVDKDRGDLMHKSLSIPTGMPKADSIKKSLMIMTDGMATYSDSLDKTIASLKELL